MVVENYAVSGTYPYLEFEKRIKAAINGVSKP